MSLKLELGKYYKSAPGIVHGPMEAHASATGNYPFVCPSTGNTFTVEGRWRQTCPSLRDLIAECDAQGKPVASSGAGTGHTITVSSSGGAFPGASPGNYPTIPGLNIEAGKYYVDYSGKAYGPMALNSVGLWQCSRTGKGFTIAGGVWLDNRPDKGNLYLRIPGPLTSAAFGGVPKVGANGLPTEKPPASPQGDVVDRALAAAKEKDSAEEERMRRLPSAEERLEEYRRNVANLAARGNLY